MTKKSSEGICITEGADVLLLVYKRYFLVVFGRRAGYFISNCWCNWLIVVAGAADEVPTPAASSQHRDRRSDMRNATKRMMSRDDVLDINRDI